MLIRVVLGSVCVGVVACSGPRPEFGSSNTARSSDLDASVGENGETASVAPSGVASAVAPAVSTVAVAPAVSTVAVAPAVSTVAVAPAVSTTTDDSVEPNMTSPTVTDSVINPDPNKADADVEPAPAVGCIETDVRGCWEQEDGTPLPGDPTTSACAIGEQSCTAEGEWGPCQGAVQTGAMRCEDFQPQVCDSTGSWANSGSVCPYLCNSNTGECEGSCSPGAMRCDGLQPQLCDTEGSWQNSGSACSFSCSATSGSCTGLCVPGSESCSGSQPQECDADGAWQPSGAACGDCSICEEATGTCVVNTGAECDDGNACTTGETCQSSGACGGGSAKTCGGADECHTVGACVPATGCPVPTVATGNACDDGNACTTGETCQSSGACGGGSDVTCQAADQCHAVGACLPASGCPAPVVKTGNCDDGNVCTSSDSCQSDGVCEGSMAAHTTSCGNNMFCDGNGACKCRTQSSWNLLTNPGFDGSTSSWTVTKSAYDSVDVDSCSGSGSVLIPGQGGITQCLPADANQTYYIGYKFKTANSGASGTARCFVAFLPAGNNCSFGDRTSTFDATVNYSNDNWVSGFAGGASDSDTTHIVFGCSMVYDEGYYDQLSLSNILPSSPGF